MRQTVTLETLAQTLLEIAIELNNRMMPEKPRMELINEKLSQIALLIKQSTLTSETLADMLSKKATQGGEHAGKNGFYCLMGALDNAAFNNNADTVAKISTLAATIFEKLDKDRLAAGLSEKATQGTYAGRNGFFCLMGALNNAAFHNNADAVAKISTLAATIFEKLDKDRLAAGLSEKATQGEEHAGKNGFYCLMGALNNAAFNNNADTVAKISTLAATIFEKLDKDRLAAGLSEKATQGTYAGKNGFYCLMGALNNATFSNNADTVAKISTLAATIFEKLDKDRLAAGLSEKATQGTYAGRNGFFCLIAALNNAAVNNNADAVAKISTPAATIFEKLDKDRLAAGLSEKATQGQAAGRNSFYYLMLALRDSVLGNNDPYADEKIIALTKTVFEKLSPVQLVAGLSEKKSGLLGLIGLLEINGFMFLGEAIEFCSRNSISNMTLSMLEKIQWKNISLEQQNTIKKHIFSKKSYFRNTLRTYLEKLITEDREKFETAVSTDTALGQLINYHTSFFGRGETETQKFCGKLRSSDSKNFSEITLLETPRGVVPEMPPVVISTAKPAFFVVTSAAEKKLSPEKIPTSSAQEPPLPSYEQASLFPKPKPAEAVIQKDREVYIKLFLHNAGVLEQPEKPLIEQFKHCKNNLSKERLEKVVAQTRDLFMEQQVFAKLFIQCVAEKYPKVAVDGNTVLERRHSYKMLLSELEIRAVANVIIPQYEKTRQFVNLFLQRAEKANHALKNDRSPIGQYYELKKTLDAETFSKISVGATQDYLQGTSPGNYANTLFAESNPTSTLDQEKEIVALGELLESLQVPMEDLPSPTSIRSMRVSN